MLTFVLGALAGLAVAAILRLTHLLSTPGTILPSLIVFTVVVLLMLRRTSKIVEGIIKGAEKHITGGRVEMAIKEVQGAMRWGRWHPFVPGQLHAIVGTLYYDTGKMNEAQPHLEKGLRWPWTTKALLGVIYFKRREEKKMLKALETAVKTAKKEPIAWTLYAWCLQARDKKDEAVKVLERALKENKGDQRLEANLELAREGKKLKTAPYGDKWTRFRLEGDLPPLPKAMRGFAVRPGFRQRPQRKR